MKCLGKNLIKYVQDLCGEDYKINEIKEDLNKRRAIPCSLKDDSVSSVLPNLVCKFNTIPIEVSASCGYW